MEPIKSTHRLYNADSILRGICFASLTLDDTNYFCEILANGRFVKMFPNLESLTLYKCRSLLSFPDGSSFPRRIRELVIEGCTLEIFPPLNGMDELEVLNLKDNYIANIERTDYIPPSVRSINLSFNKLRHVNWTIFPRSVLVIDVSYNFLSEQPPDDLRVIAHHNEMSFGQYFDLVLKTPHNIYTHSQNVHGTEAQKGARDGVSTILSIVKNNQLYVHSGEALIESIKHNMFKDTPKLSWFNIFACCSDDIYMKIYDESTSIRILRTCMHDPSTYSEVTFQQLLGNVWAIIMSEEYHEQCDTLIMRLKEELQEGESVCFTGKMTRIVNSLQGLVDGVLIGVSQREQMQARIIIIMNKLRQGAKNKDALRRELAIAIDELPVDQLMNGERDAWLAAFDDTD